MRYGIRRADDPLIVDSLKVVDHVLKTRDCRYGPAGAATTTMAMGSGKMAGRTWAGGRGGHGRCWPASAGTTSWPPAATRAVHHDVGAFQLRGGMLPEQVWDHDDLPQLEVLGQSAGSAQPLVWAHAEYLKLLR